MSESDIYTLVRAKSLVLLAEIPQTSALITLHNDKKVVVGKAQVQGLAILRNKDALELLEHGHVSTDTVYVNCDSIYNLATNYPFESGPPLSFLKNWAPEKYQADPGMLYRAVLNPQEQKSGAAFVSGIVNALTQDKEEHKAKQEEAEAKLSKCAKSVLRTNTIKIHRLHTLIDASSIQNKVSKCQRVITQDEELRLRELSIPPYPILLDVLNYLREIPNARPSDIWIKLRKEHASEGDNRIDISESIKAISEGEMIHYDSNSVELEMSKKRFANLCGQLRKIITENQ